MYFFKLLGIRFLKFDKNIPKIKINTNEGSFKKSFPISYANIKRARKHAKPEWGTDGVTEEKKQEIISEAARMNRELDLSFKVTDVIKGDWSVKTKNKSLF